MNTSNTKTSQQGRVVEFALNEPQALANMVQANETWALMGRGAGKTVGIIAPWMVRIAEAMPGHLGGVFGKTHEHLNNNIMPKILLGFTSLGYTQGEDFVVGVRPPASWPKCLYPLRKFERTITWRNGTTFQSVSLYEKGSANAFDFQSGVFDEAKYFDEAQLQDEVFPTFRGFEKKFSHLPEYLAKIFCTDKLADYVAIKWILDKRKMVDHDRVKKILQIEKLLSGLQQQLDETMQITHRQKINRYVRLLQEELRMLRKNLVYVVEGSAIDNIENLGLQWLADKMQGMNDYELKVAIKNEDPESSRAGFYPNLTDANLYDAPYPMYDYNATQPIIVALDYQASIAPLLAAQLSTLPGNNKPSLNFIHEYYALYPLGLIEAVNQFCKHFEYASNKRVIYIYDQTAIGRRASAEPVNEIVIKAFKANGWKVTKVYMGDTPDHYDKFMKINGRLKTPTKYPININKSTNPNTLISLRSASTKTSQGKTQKDKEYENAGKYPSIDQRHTTHFSDVFDQIEWAVNEMGLVHAGSGRQGGGTSMR